MSSEERLFTIRKIKGILKNGIKTPLSIPRNCAAESIFSSSPKIRIHRGFTLKTQTNRYGFQPILLSCWSASSAKLKS